MIKSSTSKKRHPETPVIQNIKLKRKPSLLRLSSFKDDKLKSSHFNRNKFLNFDLEIRSTKNFIRKKICKNKKKN